MMKNIILVILIGCLFIISCSEDFLKEDFDKSQYDPSTFYNNELHADQALNAAYSGLDAWPGYPWSTGIMHFVLGDELYQTGYAAGFNGWGPISNLNFTATLGEPWDIWSTCYAGILKANIALQAIPNAKSLAVTEPTFTDQDVKWMMGQAYFLRAYEYYILWDLFPHDRIALRRTEVKSDAEFNAAPAPADSIYNFIESDLKKAQELLIGFTNTTVPAAQKFRITRGAATALLGKFYMNENEYALAAAEFAKLLPGIGDAAYGTYALLDDFRAIHRRTNENNAESIFEIQFENLNGGAGFGGNRVNWIFHNFTMNRTGWAAAMWFNFAVPSYKLDEFERWPENIGADPDSTVYDYRAYASFWGVPGGASFTDAGGTKDWKQQLWTAETVVVGRPGALGLRKYSLNAASEAPAGLDPTWSDNNLRIIRLGDIYLLYAECMAQLNPANVDPTSTSSAIYWVDKIRERANKPSATDQAQLLSARAGVNGQLPTATALRAAKGWTLMQLVEHERYVEGFGEGWRKEDLKRWKKGPGYITDKPGWTGWQSLILPIPQNEIDRNPNYQ